VAYIRTLELVKKDVLRSMDLLVILRRLRAHGTALSFLLDGATISKISDFSHKRQVNVADEKVNPSMN
jgi:hypothetical protein